MQISFKRIVINPRGYYALCKKLRSSSHSATESGVIMLCRAARSDFLAALCFLFGGNNMSLIKIENLSFTYPSSYDPIFENVSFQIDTDWNLGFVGRNGRGKTTFLNLLLGKYEYRGR